MAEVITAMEARQKFGEMLNRVFLLKEEIIIKRAGKCIAKLAPLEGKDYSARGKLDFRKSAGLGKDLWQKMDSSKYIESERSEWESI
ncbi:MAG: prevent-host-death protein [Acidobacteria bacterium]|nr:MAG: prevent-host-death protein [Acidobacteriota bacterium]